MHFLFAFGTFVSMLELACYVAFFHHIYNHIIDHISLVPYHFH